MIEILAEFIEYRNTQQTGARQSNKAATLDAGATLQRIGQEVSLLLRKKEDRLTFNRSA